MKASHPIRVARLSHVTYTRRSYFRDLRKGLTLTANKPVSVSTPWTQGSPDAPDLDISPSGGRASGPLDDAYYARETEHALSNIRLNQSRGLTPRLEDTLHGRIPYHEAWQVDRWVSHLARGFARAFGLPVHVLAGETHNGVNVVTRDPRR